MLMISEQYIPVTNSLGLGAIVFCACELTFVKLIGAVH